MQKGLGPADCLDACAAALACSVFFFLILPLQSYLAYAGDYPFSLTSLVWSCLGRLAAAFVGLSAVLLVSSRWAGRIPHLLALGLTMAGLAESGVLSIGLPELNGMLEGYQSGTRYVVDTAALAILVLAPVLLCRWLRDFVGLFSLALLLYSAATVFDVRGEKQEAAVEAGSLWSETIPRPDVLASAEFAPSNNVIVLIVDASTVDAVADILDMEPKVASSFTGFVNYTNNVGMHWPTPVGVPSIFTGTYYHGEGDLLAYAKGVFSPVSFVNDYVRADVPTFVNVGPGILGLATGARKDVGSGRRESVLSVPMNGFYSMNVVELSTFRAFPYVLKAKYLEWIVRRHDVGGQAAEDVNDNKTMCAALGTAAVNPNYVRTLQVHHEHGLHLPVHLDEFGNPFRCPKPRYEDYVNQGRYVFKLLAKLMDDWRQKGIYDSATIVLLGDHGLPIVKDGFPIKSVPHWAFPFLMVKPAYATGPLCSSGIPTSHSKVAPLLRELCRAALDRAGIERMLTCEKRLCRNAENGKVYDWTIDAEGNVKAEVRDDDAGATPSELRALEEGREYSFALAKGECPDYLLKNGTRKYAGGMGTVGGNKRPIEFSFRVAKRRVRCTVVFEIYDKSRTAWDFDFGEGTKPQRRKYAQKMNSDEAFEGVMSDKDGVVHVKVSVAKKGKSGRMTFRKVKVINVEEL